MRDFLMELYLTHGDREFEVDWGRGLTERTSTMSEGLLEYIGGGILPIYKLTPKGLEYIKNLDNP